MLERTVVAGKVLIGREPCVCRSGRYGFMLCVLGTRAMHTCLLVADDGNIYDVLDRFTNYDDEEPKPDSRWDYFGIGGRYEGTLPLNKPQQLRRFFGLIPAGSTSSASVAKKSEIDQAAFLADPPMALFYRGQLYQCPLFAEGEALSLWQAEFRRRFAEIPDNITLQIVDAHS